MITFHCEHCHQALEARPEPVGHELHCTHCQRSTLVPRNDSRPPDPPAPLAAYSAGTAMQLWRILGGGGLFLGLLALTIAILFLSPKASMGDWLAGLGLLLLGLGAYALGMFLVVLPALDDVGARVEVMPAGLLLVRRGRPRQFAWEDIRAVWQHVSRVHIYGIPLFVTHSYTLRLQDGSTVTLNDDIGQVAELGDVIQREVTARLLPRCIEACDAGETVDFGRLRVSRQGLRKGAGAVLDWREITDIAVAEGYLCVWRAETLWPWARVAVRAVPNVFVLLALAGHYRSGRA